MPCRTNTKQTPCWMLGTSRRIFSSHIRVVHVYVCVCVCACACVRALLVVIVNRCIFIYNDLFTYKISSSLVGLPHNHLPTDLLRRVQLQRCTGTKITIFNPLYVVVISHDCYCTHLVDEMHTLPSIYLI